MINFHTYKEIHFLHKIKNMSFTEIGRRLQLDLRTVRKRANSDQFVRRKPSFRNSVLDPYKSSIRRQYELERCTGTEILRSEIA